MGEKVAVREEGEREVMVPWRKVVGVLARAGISVKRCQAFWA